MGEPRKNADDLAIEGRIRGWIRHEMEKRGVSQNEMERKLGLGRGSLSKILTENRGFGAGFVLKAMRAVKAVSVLTLLEDDPPPQYRDQERKPLPAKASPVHGQPEKPKTGGRKRHAS